METKFVEATQNAVSGFNHGKFMIGRFELHEWVRRSEIDFEYSRAERSLLARCGWGEERHNLVVDLQTGEGAIFFLGGSARADLAKHEVWVCPMFEPFLEWLYAYSNGSGWFENLPKIVELPTAPPAMAGYRRKGTNP